MEEERAARTIRTYSNDGRLVENRRLHIIKCATSVFVRKGYHNARMADVAEACGMSYGAAYHYIGSKEDVLFLIIDFAVTAGVERVEAIRERVGGLKPKDALGESIRAYLEHVDELQDMFNVINHAMVDLPQREREMVFAAEERVVGYFESILKSGIETGDFAVSDPALAAFNTVALAQQWAHRRWFLRKRYTLEQYAARLNESVSREIAADQPSRSPVAERRK